MHLRRDSLSRYRRTDEQHGVPLPQLSPGCGRTSGRMGHVPYDGIRTASWPAVGVPFVRARAPHVLPCLRHSAHVRASGYERDDRRDDLQPGRSEPVSADASLVAEPRPGVGAVWRWAADVPGMATEVGRLKSDQQGTAGAFVANRRIFLATALLGTWKP